MSSDVISFSEARAGLSKLVVEVQNGSEKIITKNGEPTAALIAATRLDHYHRLERARIHLLVLEEVEKGLSDVEAGHTKNARKGLAALKAKRASTAGKAPARGKA